MFANPRKLPLYLGVAAALAGSSSVSTSVRADSTATTVSPAGEDEDLAPQGPPPSPTLGGGELTLGGSPDAANSCLTQTICSVKERIRWQTPAWTPSQCRKIADAVATSAKRHNLSPTLLLAVMVNESDMNEKSARTYLREGKVYAKDGGLMAIRCLLDDRDRCTNGNVRGMRFKDLMDPVNNIEAGANELAHWRDGGGVTRKTIVKRDRTGLLQRVTKNVPCQHKTHAWWAHYNHGPRYIEKGYPRHYAHRVAVLDHAFASVMNSPAPELTAGRITIHDPGRRERTVERPIEPRYKKLCEQIRSAGPAHRWLS